MSNNPYSAPSEFGAVNPLTVDRPRVPTGIVIVTIVCLVLSSVNALMGCCGLGAIAMGPQLAQMAEDADPDSPNPFDQKFAQGENMALAVAARAAVTISAFGVLIGSILTLMRKNWGRQLLVISLVVAALAGGADTVRSIAEGGAEIENAMQQNKGIENMAPAEQTIAKNVAYVIFYGLMVLFAFISLFYLFAAWFVGQAKYRPNFE